MVRTRNKAKKREQPLGAAIGWGLAVTLAVGIIILIVQLVIPGTVAHNFFLLAHNNASATLPLDPLYQQWADKLQEEDTLFGTPISLLCGAIVLGWLAPSYVSRRRILLSGAGLGLGVYAVSLAFIWFEAPRQQAILNQHEGGQQVILTAPPELILSQTLAVIACTAICYFGTMLGLYLRDRSRNRRVAA